MAIDRYTVEERCTKRTLKRGFTVLYVAKTAPTLAGRRVTRLGYPLVRARIAGSVLAEIKLGEILFFSQTCESSLIPVP